MKNPIIITTISFLLSFVFIIILAFYFDYGRPGGEQVFLTVIGWGIFFQAIICYVIFIVSSVIWRNSIENKTNNIVFFIFMTFYILVVLFPFLSIFMR